MDILNTYRRWLVQQNRNSGHWAWYIMWMIGGLLLFAAIAFALPVIDVFVSTYMITELDEFARNVTILDTWTLSSRQFEVYSASSILVTAGLGRIGYLLFILGMNYATGLKFIPPSIGNPAGHWARSY
ncbi:hypothetical protein HOI83_00825 [Candidatus Uhrbacteria bacterium]|jgi:hypothetical protein|nr:hypothetical protein [Candidatus Uhrbacteria bacterium]